MKALTIRQPYASLVMLGVKPYEFRTWRTNYRGPLAIHAGAYKGSGIGAKHDTGVLAARAPAVLVLLANAVELRDDP